MALMKGVSLVFVCLFMNLFANGHIIRPNSPIDLSISNVDFHLNAANLNENVTYYSYHIHAYFLQNNQNQSAEAALLRNRFLDKFNVLDCNDDCDTWCPKICHWEFNTAPIG